MTAKSIKVKLGKPRLALLWFIPAESIFADLEAQVTAQTSDIEDQMSEVAGQASDAADQSSEYAAAAEEIERATGFNVNRIASLLTNAAEQYKRDPAPIEAAIRAIVGDNEIAAKWLLDLILGMKAENDNGADETPTGADILDFERPDDNGNPDDDGSDDGGEEP